ncbi:unnamed protein product [Ixodes pacificus]
MGGKKLTILVAFLAIGTVICQTHDIEEIPESVCHQTECQSLGLAGRLAPVTGGASGIGRGVCMILA